MSLLPQINNEINSSVKTEVTLPSKTYRLKVDSTALQLQKGNKTTVSGSEIKLTDVKFTQENKTSIKLEGSTNQVTRSGKNIFDISKYADISLWEKTTNYFMFTPILNEDMTKFKNVLSGSMQLKGTGQNLVFGLTTEKVTPTTELRILNNGTLQNTSYDFKNADNIYLTIGNSNMISADKSEIGLIFNNYNIQIEQGTTATDYEEYGASPSPDYPSPIENVEGKNKFDINQEKEIFNIMLYKYSYYLKPNTKYTISSNCPASTTANIYANSNSSNGAVYINKNQIIQSDENGYFYILVRYKAYASDSSTFNLYEKVLNGTYYIQLEEGTVATPYVPYNSLEFKVEGKNRFGNFNWKVGTYAYTLIPELNKKYILSMKLKEGQTIPNDLYFGFTSKGDYDNLNLVRWIISAGSFNSTNTVAESGFKYINNDASNKILNYLSVFPTTYATKLEEYFDIQLEELKEESTEPTDYEPYKSQVATFPLGEEKLMEGSYLADDGIHHSRKQVVLNGTETISSYRSNTINGYCGFSLTLPEKHIANSNLLSNYFVRNPGGVYGNSSTGIWAPDVGWSIYVCVPISILADVSTVTAQVNSFKSWLAEQYANGTPVIIEYELAEEEIVPYTTAQQEAYNQLNDYELFDGVNYITMISTIPGTLSLAYYDKNNINLIKTEEDRIVGFVDNLEAIKQSIYHILSIERYAYLIYDDNYGVEFEQYIGKDFDYINATIENTLQEALLYDLRILDVSVDNIEQIDINKVAINFTVDTIYGNLVMEVSIDV